METGFEPSFRRFSQTFTRLSLDTFTSLVTAAKFESTRSRSMLSRDIGNESGTKTVAQSENKLGIDEYSEISDVLCSDGSKDFDSDSLPNCLYISQRNCTNGISKL